MSFKTLKDGMFAKLFTRFPSLVDRWAKSQDFLVYLKTPWTPLTKDPRESQIALVTTAGVHLRSQRPFDMEDKEGDPTFRTISSKTVLEELMITHNYYDHHDADQDINVVLPFERLNELEAGGGYRRSCAPALFIHGPHHGASSWNTGQPDGARGGKDAEGRRR